MNDILQISEEILDPAETIGKLKIDTEVFDIPHPLTLTIDIQTVLDMREEADLRPPPDTIGRNPRIF
jgi:hypothetical protein